MINWLNKLGFALFTAACLFFAYHAFYYLFAPITNPFQQKMHAGGWEIAAHFFGAGLTLMLLPIQWSALVRKHRSKIHKVTGYIYAAGVLVGGVSGFIMALNASGGLGPKLSFGISALLWLFCTYWGIYCAIKGDYRAHQRWMTRSVALCASAITLRAVLGIGLGVLQMPFLEIYVIASWAGWGLNMILCEIMLFMRSPQRIGGGIRLGSAQQNA